MQRLSLPRRVSAAAAIAIIAVVLAGCASEQEQLQTEPRPSDTVGASDAFDAPGFPAGRSLDTVLAIHFDASGKAEYVVASIGPDSMRISMGRADLLQIYRFDSAARSFVPILADSIRWAAAYETGDLTGDGKPELIVRTDAGGNDEVATRGMRIYSADGGTIRAIYGTSRGAPAITSLNRGMAILLHGKLWPPFASHADAISYVDDIFAYRDGRFVSIRKEQGAYFGAIADQHLKVYAGLRPRFAADTVAATIQTDSLAPPDTSRAADTAFQERPHPLFQEAAQVLLAFGRGNQPRSIRSFWSSEQDYLRRRLPAEQFRELEEMYLGSMKDER